MKYCQVLNLNLRVFDTEKSALNHIRYASGQNLKAYFCTTCGGWHVSNQIPDSKEVMNVYDMVEAYHSNIVSHHEMRKEDNSVRKKKRKELEDALAAMRTNAVPDNIEECVQTILEGYSGLSGSKGLKRSLKYFLYNTYGLDLESEISTIRFKQLESEQSVKQYIMNLAERMKQAAKVVKVTGKIDLDSVPKRSGPDTPTKEEKKENRKLMTQLHTLRDKAHNIEIILKPLEQQYADGEDELCKMSAERKRAQLRKEYVEKRMEVRALYNDFSLATPERQRKFHFQGIRPKALDIVHFHTMKGLGEPYDGVALCFDENHYLIAVDMYDQPDQEDNITTCLQENIDGTFEGIWPKDTCLSKPSKIEDRMMRMMMDKYADDIERAKAFLATAYACDKEELKSLNQLIDNCDETIGKFADLAAQIEEKRAELVTVEVEMENLQSTNTQHSQSDPATVPETSVSAIPAPAPDEDASATPATPQPDLLDFDDSDTSAPVPDASASVSLTPTEQRYQHLVFIRKKKEMRDMNYPFIDYSLKPWLRFRLMANVARLVDKVSSQKSLTYVLSEEYFAELCSRARTAYRGMLAQDVVGKDSATGVLVFSNQGCEDTIIYSINNTVMLSMILVYIREGKLMFYESRTEQQILGQPRIDNYMCASMRDDGTDIVRLFNFVKNLVISFLAMERDMERTMKHFIEDGVAEEHIREYKEDDILNHDADEDVVIRDANWYSSISIDHMIPVTGYLSHRWVGKGKDKVLQEVWVKPHQRNGYHREAGVKK